MFFLLLSTAFAQPPYNQKAEYARWMAANLSWGVMSTISTMDSMTGYPFGNPISYADNATGTPYLCVTDLDQSMIDIKEDKRVSLTMSEAQTGMSGCVPSSGDPENPPCARLVLTGSFANVTTDEYDQAVYALKDKHPAMSSWGCFGSQGPSGHNFYIAKIDVQQAWLIDMYGGASVLTADDYFGTSGASRTN